MLYYMHTMQLYKSALKFFFSLLLIPAAIVVLLIVFSIGFSLDLSNAFDNESSMYMVVFPATYLLAISYAGYVFFQRRKSRQYQTLKQEARTEVLSELKSVDSVDSQILSLLDTHESLTIEDVTLKLGISQEQVLEAIRTLLRGQKIKQQIHNGIATFSKLPRG